MVFALASSRKSRSCCDKPFTFFNTCLRVKASMDVNVPISGVKPGWMPTIHAFSAATEDMGRAARLDSPTAIPTPAFRKLRRLGTHSFGSIRFPPSEMRFAGGIILQLKQTSEVFWRCRSTQRSPDRCCEILLPPPISKRDRW